MTVVLDWYQRKEIGSNLERSIYLQRYVWEQFNIN